MVDIGRFPLADWIDSHPNCRYDLATSGMRGSVAPPPWPAKRPPRELEAELRCELADHLRVPVGRLFLSHGASEANAWVLGYLAGELRRAGGAPTCRVELPEYPPLRDAAQAVGFRLRSDGALAGAAVTSNPRNPEGELWSEERVARFADGTRHLLVDETFREFADRPTLARAGLARLWTTGSFTKFYGADEARVGFVVAPPEVPERFARYVGLVSDELPPASAAMALALLRRFHTVQRSVRRVFERNASALASAFPGHRPPAAPLFFDRLGRSTGHSLAEACLAGSVLVCPGEYFGEPRGVRIALTRRNFPRGLRAYLRARWAVEDPVSARGAEVGALDRAPRRPAQRPLGRRGRRRGRRAR